MRAAYSDEAGDTGFDFGAGSSPLFTLVILLPHDPETLLNQVVMARRRLGKPETFEFHFRQANPEFGRVFFEAISVCSFDLFAAVLHKQDAPALLRRTGKSGMYARALSGLALRSPMPFSDVKLHLDGAGSQKRFLQTVKNIVRSACRKPGFPEQNFKDIRVLDSAHPLIQCADMVAGAVNERAVNGDERWLALARPLVRVWWEEHFAENRNPPD